MLIETLRKRGGGEVAQKRVLLFGDIGIDDIIALAYASLNDEIEIVEL
jgi:inosine-uridine nucleoside N-ribohydrolase